MFKNYLKVAVRNITKHKLYSFVNITGLTAGIVGCILIGLFVWTELRYDDFHTKGDRVVRVTMEYGAAGTVNKTAVTGTKVGPQFKRTFPQVESFTRAYKSPRTIANGATVFEEKNVLYVDADFLNIFSFDLLKGNSTTALSLPYTIVLSETAAKKYFGSENPIGKTLRINDLKDYEVTAVVKDAPLNSQIQYDMLVSFTSPGASKTEEWWTANYITYLLLHNDKQIQTLSPLVANYMKKISNEELKLSGTQNYLTYHLEPLKKVHLFSSLDGLEPNGNITYVYVLSIIAILILLIACVNYTNLATAQSAGRGTEIGVRKVLGAGRLQLLKQFFGESVILTFIAQIIAIVVSIVLLPLFNSITGKVFTADLLFQPIPLICLLFLGIIISFLAGAYPAFILSNTLIVSILKSGLRMSNSGGLLKKSLIVFQFVISVFLVVATIVVLTQVSYIQNKQLGYNREQVMVLPVDYKMKAGYENLKKAFEQNPNVLSVTGAYEDPTSIEWGDGISSDDGQGKKELSVTAVPVDLNYTKTMGMQIIAGRDFNHADFALQDTSNDYANYRGSYILNENAVKTLGWTPEQAIGKTVSRGVPGLVTGVVKDFHFSSLHTPIAPLVIFLDTTLVRQLFVKVKQENLQATIQSLSSIWKDRVGYRPFDYHFLDDDFNALYKNEERTAKLFTIFSGLAISLAALGLFALAAFSAIQRTKEIGIRKILGANTGSIILLIAKQFVILVLIGIVIASPIAWWAGNQWLQDFEYRIDISWWMFLVAGLSAMAIALITVSYHAIRASLANPVKSLRNE
jgi:putative ABC transport system permease protein